MATPRINLDRSAVSGPATAGNTNVAGWDVAASQAKAGAAGQGGGLPGPASAGAVPGPVPDVAAPGNESGADNPYSRQLGESTADWTRRLRSEANGLVQLQSVDPRAAAAARSRMNEAIAADPEAQQRYLADAQAMSADAFQHPERYGSEVPDAAVGFSTIPGEPVHDRIARFAASNMSPVLRMGADGKVYDLSKSLSQADARPSFLSSLYDENARAVLRQSVADHGLSAVPQELLGMAMLGAVRAGGPRMGRGTTMPTAQGRVFDPASKQWVDSTTRQAASPPVLGSDVKQVGTQVSGKFPTTLQPPNSVQYRLDSNGNITNYQVWGEDGLPAYRVDIQGRSHNGQPTPHTLYYPRNRGITGKSGDPSTSNPQELP